MPLPLAHPAAVLPLRRFCPKYLSFSALIIGSVVPDIAYALNFHHSFPRLVATVFGQGLSDFLAGQGIHSWEGLSHTLFGGVVFGLPLGLLLIVAFRFARGALVATLPNPHRELLAPLCRSKQQPLVSYLGSLLIGVWLHLLWDSFAKDNWWLAKIWPAMQLPVAEAGSSHLELYRAIWIVSSMGGTAALVLAYLSFLRKNGRSFWVFDRREAPYYFLWLTAAALSGLIATVLSLHFMGFGTSPGMLFHVFHAFYGVFVTVFGSFVLVIALVSMARRSAAGSRL